MELINVHYSTGMEGRAFKESSMEGGRELFLSEYRTEIVRIDCLHIDYPPLLDRRPIV